MTPLGSSEADQAGVTREWPQSQLSGSGASHGGRSPAVISQTPGTPSNSTQGPSQERRRRIFRNCPTYRRSKLYACPTAAIRQSGAQHISHAEFRARGGLHLQAWVQRAADVRGGRCWREGTSPAGLRVQAASITIHRGSTWRSENPHPCAGSTDISKPTTKNLCTTREEYLHMDQEKSHRKGGGRRDDSSLRGPAPRSVGVRGCAG